MNRMKWQPIRSYGLVVETDVSRAADTRVCCPMPSEQPRGSLVSHRLLVWLGISPGGIVLGCVAAKLLSGPLGNSINSDSK